MLFIADAFFPFCYEIEIRKKPFLIVGTVLFCAIGNCCNRDGISMKTIMLKKKNGDIE